MIDDKKIEAAKEEIYEDRFSVKWRRDSLQQ